MIVQNLLSYIYDQPLYHIKDIGILEQSTESEISLIKSGIVDKEPLVLATKEIEKAKNMVSAKVDPASAPDALIEKCEKRIWLLVELSNGETISADEYDLLNKTMTALKQTLEDAAIFIPLEMAHSYFKNLDLQGKIIIDFGMRPINLCSPPLLPNIIHNIRNSNYLPTQSLTILQNDLALKKDWWMQMKTLFN